VRVMRDEPSAFHINRQTDIEFRNQARPKTKSK
jgi:hypothetical protein